MQNSHRIKHGTEIEYDESGNKFRETLYGQNNEEFTILIYKEGKLNYIIDC